MIIEKDNLSPAEQLLEAAQKIAAKEREQTKKSKKEREGKIYKSGLVPEGDVRLTTNIREDLHVKLKMESAKNQTTIGEMIEQLISEHL